MTMIAWEAADSCPNCGARLVLLDDGAATAGVECRSCGYLDTWTLLSRGGDEW